MNADNMTKPNWNNRIKKAIADGNEQLASELKEMITREAKGEEFFVDPYDSSRIISKTDSEELDGLKDLSAFDRLVLKKFKDKRQNAKERNIEFELTIEDVAKLMKTKRCYFNNSYRLTLQQGPFQLTLDRLDNTKGYVPGNVVACSAYMNNIKGNLNHWEIRDLYRGLAKAGIV